MGKLSKCQCTKDIVVVRLINRREKYPSSRLPVAKCADTSLGGHRLFNAFIGCTSLEGQKGKWRQEQKLILFTNSSFSSSSIWFFYCSCPECLVSLLIFHLSSFSECSALRNISKQQRLCKAEHRPQARKSSRVSSDSPQGFNLI